MTQLRYLTGARVEQVAALLGLEGITTAAIAASIGVTVGARMSQILGAAVESGRAFCAVARVSDGMKTPERVYFSTAEARDAFMVRYLADKLERRRASWRDKQFSRRGRDRSAEVAARSAKRAATHAARMQAMAERAAQRKAVLAAEREIEKAKQRQIKEAEAAEKAREKTEAKSLQKRLKAETRAAGKVAAPRGTASPAPKVVRGPAHIAGDLDLSHARVTPCPSPKNRYAIDSAPSVISANECRPWAKAVA